MQAPSVTIKNRSPRVGRKEPAVPTTAAASDITPSPCLNLNPSSAYIAMVKLTTTSAGAEKMITSSPPHSRYAAAEQGRGAEFRSTSARPMREAVVLGVSFFFVYTSFHALQNLESSLHGEEGDLGLVTLAATYAASFLGSFLTPALVDRLGVKSAILSAWLAHLLFVVCNFIPRWWSLIPGSVLLGLWSCPLWTSLELYMTSLARQQVAEEHTKTTTGASSAFRASFSRLHGVFFAIFLGSQFCGNLVSSAFLSPALSDTRTADLQTALPCGATFCATSALHRKYLEKPEAEVLWALLTLFLLFELCGLAVSALYLPDLLRPRRRGWGGSDVMRQLGLHLATLVQPQTYLLAPIILSRTMSLALEVGTFTQAYVSCTLGVGMVGYVMAAWGLSTLVSAGVVGRLSGCTGRWPLCLGGLAAEGVVFGVLSQWQPSSRDVGTLFLLAVLMGLVEGVWALQIDVLIALLFPLRADSALALKGTWSSLGMAMAFWLSACLCPLPRFLVAIIVSVIAFFSCLVLEAKYLR